MKTRAAFCLITTPLTRISRRLCKDILNPRRAARSPFIPVNIAAIKQECRCSIQCVASMYGNPTLIHKQENCMINTRTSLLQCILCSIYFIAVVFWWFLIYLLYKYMHVSMAGQLRLTEEGENYVPNIKPRGTTTLEPVVARLGINTKMEKPALLLKSENDHKKPEKIFFPPSASQPRKNFFLVQKMLSTYW